VRPTATNTPTHQAFDAAVAHEDLLTDTVLTDTVPTDTVPTEEPPQ
jgi:hypothetical protein